MIDEAQETIEFGRFQLLPRRRELLADGVPVALGSRAFEILMMLTDARGELVTKDDILRRVWPGVVVEENNLVVQISTLRKALGPDRNFIRTESGRGYRFVAEVHASTGASTRETHDEAAANHRFEQSTGLPGPPTLSTAPTTEVEDALEGPTEVTAVANSGGPTRHAPRLVFWVILASALLVIAAALTSVFLLRSPTSPRISSVAVLPLENLSGDASQDYFADGVTEELIAGLAQFRALRVISRTSIMSYKNARKLLPDIARELNVDAVVEGSVLRSGGRVRITVELIEVPVERHVWGQSFEADLRDAIPLQTSVAQAIASQIHAVVSPQASASGSKSVDPDAYEAYLEGRYFWNKRSEEGLRKAIEYFNLATDKDPTYAKAYSGLADAYALSGDWEYGILSPQDALPKAKAAATKALALDDNLGEAHTSLGFILDLSWDWAGAETEFERAIALYPSYATAHLWHAWHLMVRGQTSEGIAELQDAKRLDPLSLIIGADLADALCIAGRYDESIAQSRRTLELDANFAVAHYELGQALTQKKLYDAAIAEFREAIQLSGSGDIFFAGLARAYASAGSKDRAQEILDSLERKYREQNAPVEPNIAIIYVALGENDPAMAWLEKAFQRRFNPSILLRPAFDALRFDGRFQDLLHRIGIAASPTP